MKKSILRIKLYNICWPYFFWLFFYFQLSRYGMLAATVGQAVLEYDNDATTPMDLTAWIFFALTGITLLVFAGKNLEITKKSVSICFYRWRIRVIPWSELRCVGRQDELDERDGILFLSAEDRVPNWYELFNFSGIEMPYEEGIYKIFSYFAPRECFSPYDEIKPNLESPSISFEALQKNRVQCKRIMWGFALSQVVLTAAVLPTQTFWEAFPFVVISVLLTALYKWKAMPIVKALDDQYYAIALSFWSNEGSQ